MSAPVVPAIAGTGFAVPEQVRTNDDPVFDWLKQNEPQGMALFNGYDERRVLGPGQTVASIMVQAAEGALKSAGVAPDAIDLLLGYGSVAPYITPNVLAEVHAMIGLGAGVPVLPLADDFTNFNSSLVVADALLRAGRATNVLIVCGDNWTQYVDYRTPQAISAGDGAGAAVVTASTKPGDWTLADQAHITASADYGAMFMAPDAAGTGWSAPYIHITAAGLKDFVAFGEQQAPTLVTSLLERNDLDAADVTIIPHQASAALISAWKALPQLAEATFVDTITQYGNVVLAAIPLTLAACGAQIQTDHLVLLGLGVQLHASALLLTR